MAANKKSFIWYVDTIDVFEKLTDEEAGRLVKHLMRYVNDLHPEAPDRLTELLFEPFKRYLKRDLKKWEGEIEVKSRLGIIGNIKRWNKEVYDLYAAKTITFEKAVEMFNEHKLSLQRQNNRNSDEIIATATKTSLSIAVSDSVSDSVSVSEDKERERKEDTLPSPVKPVFLKDGIELINGELIKTEDIPAFLISEIVWKEQAVCMRHHLTIEEADAFILEFTESLKDRCIDYKTPQDAKTHFINWLKMQYEKSANTRKNTSDSNKRKQQFQNEFAEIIRTSGSDKE